MIGTTLYGLLSIDPTVASLVASRIYPHVVPQGSQLPAIVYTLVDEIPENSLLGWTSKLSNATVQIDAYAKTYVTAETVGDALVAALSSRTDENASVVLARRSSYEDETSLYRASLDVSFWLEAE